MPRLPDMEALGVFARVVELRSFAAAAEDLKLSKATVSKAVGRLETRLGARLFNRTSRRLALTETGAQLAERARRLLADAEAAEDDILARSAQPRGLVRLAAPMSFGLIELAPILPDFLAQYPEVSIDLHMSDDKVDLVGMGFDLALRIADLPDSSLVARRIRTVERMVVAAPAYLERHGRPTHPSHLAEHACLGYAYLPTPETWRFSGPGGEQVAVRPAGPLRANNAEALLPALEAGLGLAVQPDFIVRDCLAKGRLTAVLPEWRSPPIALHLVSPPGGPRPVRITALADYLVRRLGGGKAR
ncbi:MAG: LysR family transcriptional regulator [Phenylobacterium sp.]|uniref:LysR family transcriptional regulator n=1 Tax=Phenylobacterium sp. TaxID=1871053 RepID=UPI0017D24C9A|nr:LysR family transcriptional regulator [Phenylobacterium sp.]MBA4795331.1 LysR family transcriptional regulator [Phenylobacterium sp.]